MPDSADVVAEISRQGWLQGDIILGSALAEHIPEAVIATQLDGALPTHWILVSHSCTVHARNYGDAPLIEWIACKLVKKKPFNKYLNALNPRQLHIELAPKLHFDLKIQRRVWTSRAVLPELQREAAGPQLSDEQRETLTYWLAHGYTRIAMPDRLVERLKQYDRDGKPYGLGVQVDNFLEVHAPFIRSAWVSFYPRIELTDPAQPYEITFRFLVKQEHVRELDKLQTKLSAAMDECPDLGEGLVLDEALVTPLRDFSMLDAEDFIHYNMHDWLSLGDEEEDS